ncbi:hypothetical protein [Streptomyces sp. ISL-98]|uniref:hypothetical protein n=1 Tax=Streptomyces sp. ISL-98 TaxID=2819192 RepID=UPI0027E419E6|nr:hypothetical protein [Streptomyces sp. ISL-98]
MRHARTCSPAPGNTVTSIAKLLGVSRNTVYKHVPERRFTTEHRSREATEHTRRHRPSRPGQGNGSPSCSRYTRSASPSLPPRTGDS